MRTIKDSDVLGIDKRAFLSEKITHQVLPFISRRALKRVKDRLEPPVKCDCCDGDSVDLVSNSEIYNGREYGEWPYVYLCLNCGAYVGLHKFTDLPLGTMADKKTREARKKKQAFSRAIYIRFNGDTSEAYKWLAKKMGISTKICHFGFFSIEQCDEVVRHAENLMHQMDLNSR